MAAFGSETCPFGLHRFWPAVDQLQTNLRSNGAPPCAAKCNGALIGGASPPFFFGGRYRCPCVQRQRLSRGKERRLRFAVEVGDSLGTRKRGLRPAPTKHHLFRETLGRVDGIAEGVVNEPELRGFHMSLYFHLG
jgi:hypothetical protein